MAATSSGTATVTLPTDRQILITREFDAPRHLVYKAWTTPVLVKRWWHGTAAGSRSRRSTCESGAAWRYVSVTESGMEVAFHGQFREIVPNQRIVSTEVYEGIPDAEQHAALNTLTLTERDGRTLLTVLVEHPSKEGRDATSTRGWSRVCRTRSTCWSRSRSRSAERITGRRSAVPATGR
jgi:uncharacterized protein YndB with AHSA1/START domain